MTTYSIPTRVAVIQNIHAFCDLFHLSTSQRAHVIEIFFGHSCEETAHRVGKTPDAVSCIRKRIYAKVGAKSAIDLMSIILDMKPEVK